VVAKIGGGVNFVFGAQYPTNCREAQTFDNFLEKIPFVSNFKRLSHVFAAQGSYADDVCFKAFSSGGKIGQILKIGTTTQKSVENFYFFVLCSVASLLFYFVAPFLSFRSDNYFDAYLFMLHCPLNTSVL
jgi:hypothetical protein